MSRSIKTYSEDELRFLLDELGQPSFRAKQLYEWLHIHHVGSYEEMTNLPKALRELLAEGFPLEGIILDDKQVSADGTRKYLFRLGDGTQVETVGIPTFDGEGDLMRLTVCVSTQAGCPMECAFCATGHQGLTRSLSSNEIADQVYAVQEDFGHRVSNVVAMGQGEPFLNYEASLAAMRKLNEKQGLNIGARHITISTCGVIDGIERLAEEPEQFTLAVSLHSAVQPVRNALMPKVASMPLPELKASLQRYTEKTNRRVTLEYLLIEDVNDTDEDLEALIEFCRGLLCHVNLLPLNAIDGYGMKGSPADRLRRWKDRLEQGHTEATIRVSHGSDIAGACGQLKNKR